MAFFNGYFQFWTGAVNMKFDFGHSRLADCMNVKKFVYKYKVKK